MDILGQRMLIRGLWNNTNSEPVNDESNLLLEDGSNLLLEDGSLLLLEE